jgi:predicted nucleic acid-binding protein
VTLASLQAALRGIRRIAVDTSVILAASDAADSRQRCARWLLDEIERGRFSFAMISSLTVAEALVRAVNSSFEEGVAAQTALRNFPHLTVGALDFDIAVEVAHIRGTTKLKMPDAIVLGTAIAHQVEAIVHGDDEWATKAKAYAAALRLVNLGDHCS